jgi:hypothetical protein
MLTGGGKTPTVNIPAPAVPAAPAPTRRTDTGSTITLGTDAVQNQRVSGRGKASSSSSVDILAGLGRSSGISI